MGEVINLRRARKAKVRVTAEHQAAENRILHGQSRATREAASAEQDLQARRLAAHRRERGENGDGV